LMWRYTNLRSITLLTCLKMLDAYIKVAQGLKMHVSEKKASA